MRRLLPLAAALALIAPGVAAAKGPSAATISGPGLKHAIAINGYGEGDASSPLGILVTQGGFFQQAYQQTPSMTTAARPQRRLGPRYKVTYTLPGPSNESKLRQDLYPYATGGPVTYMAPGQTFWETNSTPGGWFRGTGQLKRMLVKAGLPARAPIHKGNRDHTVSVAVGAGVAAAAGVLALLYRRRPVPSD
jgi:hypothetical protein